MASQAPESATALFPDSQLPQSASEGLPEGYVIRSLRRSDYSSGFLDCLRILTVVGDISETAWLERFDSLAAQKGYYIIVIEDTAKKVVVATGAVLVENKLYV